jgi:hypothetical protein
MKRKITLLSLVMAICAAGAMAQTCAPPTALTVTLDSPAVFFLTIDFEGPDTTWEKCEVQLQKAGETTWKRSRIDPLGDGSYSLLVNIPGNLEPFTTYSVRGRCACSLSPVDASNFSDTTVFTTDGPARLAELETTSLFPNPASSDVQVAYTAEVEGMANIRVVDLTGRTLIANQFDMIAGANRINMNVADLSNGSYFLAIEQNGVESVLNFQVAH